MWWFMLFATMVVITLLAASPLLVAASGENIASALGCPVSGDPPTGPPCIVLGVDVVGMLTWMEGAGYVGLLTFPILLALAWVWVGAIVAFVVWGFLRLIRAAGHRHLTERATDRHSSGPGH
jgi:hypothetical protein